MAVMYAPSKKGATIVRTTGNSNEAGQLEILAVKKGVFLTPGVDVFETVEQAEAATLAGLEKTYKATAKKLTTLEKTIGLLGGVVPVAAEPGTDEAINEDDDDEDEDEYEEDA